MVLLKNVYSNMYFTYGKYTYGLFKTYICMHIINMNGKYANEVSQLQFLISSTYLPHTNMSSA